MTDVGGTGTPAVNGYDNGRFSMIDDAARTADDGYDNTEPSVIRPWHSR